MLLNEFLKEHKTVQEQGATLEQQRKDFEVTIAQQQKQIDALTGPTKGERWHAIALFTFGRLDEGRFGRITLR